jgi:hypothetical protein
VVDEELMQLYAPYGKAHCACKICARGMFLVLKLDSPEWKGVFQA